MADQVPVNIVPVVLPVNDENPPEQPIQVNDAVPPIQQQDPPLELQDQIKTLREELDALKGSQQGPQGIAAALQLVRQLASAPTRFRDPSMIVSALQSLADEARCAKDPKAAEYEAIFRQTRPLMFKPEFGDVIIRLLGTKEETSVASTIAKMVKGTWSASSHPYSRRPSGGRGFGTRPSGPRRGRGACFTCGRQGHFQRSCPAINANHA